MGVLPNAGKNIERFASGGGGVLDSVGREEGEAMMFREIDQLAVEPVLAPNEMALQLNIDALAAKGLEEQLSAVRECATRSRVSVRPRNERDQALREFRQFIVAKKVASFLAP